MEITNEQAEKLLSVRKKIVLKDNSCPASFSIDAACPMNVRIHLVSEDGENTFIWDIFQSRKGYIKVSLHIQDEDSSIGLFRVDYNGNHTNPESANENLPERYRPFLGRRYLNESHVHYYVEGYRSLAWALPIEDTNVRIKQVKVEDVNDKLSDIIHDIATIINVDTEIQILAMAL